MSTKPADLTPEALAGFGGAQNPYLGTSTAWYAHEFGAYLQASGRPAPTDVRMGRGDSIRCRDLRFTFKHVRQINAAAPRVETLLVTFTRVE